MKKIDQDNRLIAEFMGKYNVHDTNGHWECNNCGHQWSAILEDNEVPIIHSDCKPDIINLAKYHISWDWLMPVVEKIESLGYSYDRINADIFINTQKGENVIPNPMDGNIMTMLQKTYKAVVEFITWYNEKNSYASTNK